MCGVKDWGRPWSWPTGQSAPTGVREADLGWPMPLLFLSALRSPCLWVSHPNLTYHPYNFLFFSTMSAFPPAGSRWAQSGSMPMASETPQCPQEAARKVGLPGTGAWM